MMLGMESYTDVPMVPKGMFYNPYSNLLFLWGNFLLQRCGTREGYPMQRRPISKWTPDSDRG